MSHNQAAWHAGYHEFLRAAYRAIRKGPNLVHGKTPLAVGFEFLKPSGLKPYFLGHAYIRALQFALAEKSRHYENSERFFLLVMRILRSSARAILMDTGGWEQPKMASRVYGWVQIVRDAPRARVEALRGQADAIDVLHFLATGEERSGYEKGRGDIESVRQIVPRLWKEFEHDLSQRELPGAGTLSERAARLVGAWIDSTMALNVSLNGEVFVTGWIPMGLDPLHVMALSVDHVVWWLAVTQEDLAKLGMVADTLPKLAPSALRAPFEPSSSGYRCLIDSFVSYTHDPQFAGGSTDVVMMPEVAFRLWSPATPNQLLHLKIAPARPGVIGMHLQVVADKNLTTLQFGPLFRLRLDVRHAPESDMLATALERHSHNPLAKVLRESTKEEELAVSRVTANVERHILGTLLGREPVGEDLTLLEHGIGAVPQARKFGPLIAATYSTFALIDPELADNLHSVNSLAAKVLGKPIFAIDDRRVVRYRGLWGRTSTATPTGESP